MPAPGSRSTGGGATTSSPTTTASDASRIQPTQARSGGDLGMRKGSFKARVQSAMARHAAAASSGTPATPPNSAAPGAKFGQGVK
ncbi:hypothetical protein FOMPIDRAFT_93510 [Fomitopsis schrenkii]|uniref:SMP domain-containing protein n=1 Tax=Fomitopsis schrenkii TaxID=2126942 RepID=S8DQB2_FOMSC|nr:hypothetical protein FOMPIDRAFT_93510 [Fomitopsis schrenkii]